MLRHLILMADAFDDAAIAAVCQLRDLQTLKLASKANPNYDKSGFEEAEYAHCSP